MGEKSPPAQGMGRESRVRRVAIQAARTEFGVLGRIDDYPYIGGDSRIALSFDLGWMKNISESGAVGFSG